MTLIAHIPNTWMVNSGGGVITQQQGSWTIVPGYEVGYYRAEIDLRGLTTQEKTFFPVSAMIQGNQELTAGNYSLGESVHDVIVVSTVPLIDDDIVNCAYGYLPGMIFNELSTAYLGTTNAGMDLQNIVFGQTRTWVFDSQTVPFMRLHNQDNFGTNTGVASETLYCYRILRLPTSGGADLQPLPIAVVVAGAIGEEKDLSRLMRMKRNTRIQP